jgi:hypothetical protein
VCESHTKTAKMLFVRCLWNRTCRQETDENTPTQLYAFRINDEGEEEQREMNKQGMSIILISFTSKRKTKSSRIKFASRARPRLIALLLLFGQPLDPADSPRKLHHTQSPGKHQI